MERLGEPAAQRAGRLGRSAGSAAERLVGGSLGPGEAGQEEAEDEEEDADDCDGGDEHALGLPEGAVQHEGLLYMVVWLAVAVLLVVVDLRSWLRPAPTEATTPLPTAGPSTTARVV